MSNLKVNTINDASGGSAAVLYGVASPPNSMGFRNRLINSDMRIDQRNAGASVTIGATTVTYTLDRWAAYCQLASKISIQRSTVAPEGFTNSLIVTSLAATTASSTDPYVLFQKIEGFNWSDLSFGTANTKSVALSFWVRSSVTGTFSGVLKNNAETYSYPFSYQISSANTWEQKTVIISGSVNGTWPTDNSASAVLTFDLGSGSSTKSTAGSWANSALNGATGSTNLIATNGATFYITGVQLEAGTVASPFERRDYGRELMMCQRYYFKTVGGDATSSPLGVGFVDTTTTAVVANYFPVEMRTAPTAVETTGTAADYRVRRTGSSVVCSVVPSFFSTTKTSGATVFTVASGLTAGQGAFGGTTSANTGYLAWSAEL